ncbi:MAG TPA: hypothetical protein PLN89_03335, partial [Elusimicrobiota bacterium]|nr:hypothetical protein [Elusimicrobiota bacterium]
MRTRATLPRCALVACVLLALSTLDARRASADEPTFESANAAFADGRFDEALDAFAQLAARDGASAAILYNLGNAAFRAGKPQAPRPVDRRPRGRGAGFVEGRPGPLGAGEDRRPGKNRQN